MKLGPHLKKLREDKNYSLRRLAKEAGISASYLSRLETEDDCPPPIEEKIRSIAKVLDEHPYVLLALADRVPSEMKRVMFKRPVLVGDLLAAIEDLPDNAVLKIARVVRDGEW